MARHVSTTGADAERLAEVRPTPAPAHFVYRAVLHGVFCGAFARLSKAAPHVLQAERHLVAGEFESAAKLSSSLLEHNDIDVVSSAACIAVQAFYARDRRVVTDGTEWGRRTFLLRTYYAAGAHSTTTCPIVFAGKERSNHCSPTRLALLLTHPLSLLCSGQLASGCSTVGLKL